MSKLHTLFSNLKLGLLRQPEPLLGIDISNTSIKLVELGKDGKKNGLRLERCCSEPLSSEWIREGNITNFEQVTQALQRLVTKSASRATRVALALPNTNVITKKIELPAGLNEYELEVQVEMEAAHYIPFDLEEVSIDFVVLDDMPTNSANAVAKTVQVLMAATRKDRIEDYQAMALSVGLTPVVMDVVSYANRLAIGRVLGGGASETIALIKIGGYSYSLQLLRGDEVLYDTEEGTGSAHLNQLFSQHYGLSHEETEQMKRSQGFPPESISLIVQPFVMGLAQDIARALQLGLTSSGQNAAAQILLFGGGAHLPNIAETVQQYAGAPARLLNPFEGMSLNPSIQPSRLRQEAASYLTACGLALRRFDPS